jgi:hypothetical protein
MMEMEFCAGQTASRPKFNDTRKKKVSDIIDISELEIYLTVFKIQLQR